MTEFGKTYESPSIPSRNELLADMVANGAVPTLPFELEELKLEFEDLVIQQEVNGKLLGEAMSDSSETWHDNAAADTINAASVGLTSKAKAIIKRLREAVVIEYPSSEDDEATLGSLVYLSFNGGSPEPMLITAITPRLSEVYSNQVPHDCEVVTMTSPLGMVLVGAKAGQQVTCDVNGRRLSITVVSVSQLNPGF